MSREIRYKGDAFELMFFIVTLCVAVALKLLSDHIAETAQAVEVIKTEIARERIASQTPTPEPTHAGGGVTRLRSIP